MMDEGDEGARVGLWAGLGVVALLVAGLIGGLLLRQTHQAQPKVATVAPLAATVAATAAATAIAPVPPADVLLDAPLAGELLGQLYFAVGASALPADAATVVATAQAALAASPASSKLVLSGFHDASGDPVKNAELAKERAKAVRAALQSAGVDASRVGLRKPESTTGVGKPEAARRVEIRLVP